MASRRTLAESFPCPSCGCLKSRVLPKYPKIQPGHGYVRKRVRKCERCGEQFTTTERADPRAA
jgi:transcriptional regulator NrdR family protein